MTAPRRLLLVGGGHTHVEVLRRLARDPIEGVETLVVSDADHSVYSGMVPGFVAGQYRHDEVRVDVAALTRRAGASWLQGRATALDPGAQQLHLEDGTRLDYHAASLDVGATVAGLDVPGVREIALPSRPIARLVERLERANEGPIAVVGAGAAGVELVCCLRRRSSRPSEEPPSRFLIEAGPRILPGASGALRRAAEAALRQRGVTLLCGEAVTQVGPRGLTLASGQEVEAACVLWVTGAAPHPFLTRGGLPLDASGFVRIEPTLEVPGFPGLFAVGDCASLPGAARAGVYAVRQGPVLAANLRAHFEGSALRRFVPQRDFLQLLNLGDGSAIASKWGFAARGRLAMRLKDRIDRAWVAAYRP